MKNNLIRFGIVALGIVFGVPNLIDGILHPFDNIPMTLIGFCLTSGAIFYGYQLVNPPPRNKVSDFLDALKIDGFMGNLMQFGLSASGDQAKEISDFLNSNEIIYGITQAEDYSALICTDQRLILWNKPPEVIELNMINYTEITPGTLEHELRVSESQNRKTWVFKGMDKLFLHFCKGLEEALKKYTKLEKIPVQDPTKSKEINKIMEMLEKGLITEAEFKQLKDDIFNQ